jgi:hypothetical protein
MTENGTEVATYLPALSASSATTSLCHSPTTPTHSHTPQLPGALRQALEPTEPSKVHFQDPLTRASEIPLAYRTYWSPPPSIGSRPMTSAISKRRRNAGMGSRTKDSPDNKSSPFSG